jgi:hypothetical protein
MYKSFCFFLREIVGRRIDGMGIVFCWEEEFKVDEIILMK